MSRKPNIVTLVLAAGGSTRMGSPKQLLKWGQRTLLGHTIETVGQLNSVKTVVVLGANYDIIEPIIAPYQIEILMNKHWESGLGNSLAFGINSILESKIHLDGVLIVLADQPLINTTYLNKLFKKFESGKQQIIASIYKKEKQGVPVLFDKYYFDELSKLNNDNGAKNLLQKHTDFVKHINAEELVSDIDTLEDYEKLYKLTHQ